jgi:hypothetical protein
VRQLFFGWKKQSLFLLSPLPNFLATRAGIGGKKINPAILGNLEKILSFSQVENKLYFCSSAFPHRHSLQKSRALISENFPQNRGDRGYAGALHEQKIFQLDKGP